MRKVLGCGERVEQGKQSVSHRACNMEHGEEGLRRKEDWEERRGWRREANDDNFVVILCHDFRFSTTKCASSLQFIHSFVDRRHRLALVCMSVRQAWRRR